MTARWTGAIGPAIDSHATLDVLWFICLWGRLNHTAHNLARSSQLRNFVRSLLPTDPSNQIRYHFTGVDSCIPDNRELRAWLPEQLFPRLWSQLDD
ncbi:hypothetical protein LB504_006512 [Fusarium proliferatum]|nr:hypothetical protein LB504_006512 [Fusarium proliferatum]